MGTLHDKVAAVILKSGGMAAHSWGHFKARWLNLSGSQGDDRPFMGTLHDKVSDVILKSGG